MPGPTTRPTPVRSRLLYGKALENYIRQGALRRGLDPEAVVEVVDGEGGWYGAVGDNGTSFGPFQMHWQGAMPSQYVGNYDSSKSFANSPAGVDYALDHAAAVARGASGAAAVSAIVARFERPANPAAEISGDLARGPLPPGRPARPETGPASGGGGGGGIGGFFSDVGGGFESAAEGYWKTLTGTITSPLDAIKAFLWLANPTSWLRMVEFVTGGILMIFGFVLLAVTLFARSETGQAIASAASALPGSAGIAGRVTAAAGRPKRAAVRETRAHVQRRTTPTPEQRRDAIRARTRELELDRQARDEERRSVRADFTNRRLKRRSAALGRDVTDIPF